MFENVFTTLFPLLMWTAALSSGLMAGIYFAFSVFIMAAFDRIPVSHAIEAMNSINKTIVRSLFMPLFFGSTIVSFVLIFAGIGMQVGTVGSAILAAGVIYTAGMFLCTVFFNVPLNNQLARADQNSADAHSVWKNYLKKWTFWNHLRTLASLVTCALCIYALLKVVAV